VPRVDGLEKVTGRARYVTDLVIPGMAHARVMRSPYAHARVRRVDVTRARALTGVLAALCGADLTWCEPYYGPAYRDRPVLAIDVARYEGEPVAAVAAVDEATADAALDLIEVDYEPLPPVITLEEALAPGAPLVHTGKPQAGIFADLSTLRPEPGTNICHQFHFARGDSAGALPASTCAWGSAVTARSWRSSATPTTTSAPTPTSARASSRRARTRRPAPTGSRTSSSPRAPSTRTRPPAARFAASACRSSPGRSSRWSTRPPTGSAAIRSSSGGRTSWPTAKSSRRATRRSTASSSRSTTMTGRAVQVASEDVREQLLRITAEALGVATRDLTLDEGAVVAPARRLPYAEVLLLRFGMSGGELIGRGVIAPGRTAAPLGGSTPFWEMAVGAAEVSVDEETG